MFHFSKSLNAILIGGVSGNQSLTSKRILLIGSRWILPPTVQLNVSKVMTPLIQTKGLNEIIFKIINSSNRVILFYDFSSYDFALKLKNMNRKYISILHTSAKFALGKSRSKEFYPFAFLGIDLMSVREKRVW